LVHLFGWCFILRSTGISPLSWHGHRVLGNCQPLGCWLPPAHYNCCSMLFVQLLPQPSEAERCLEITLPCGTTAKLRRDFTEWTAFRMMSVSNTQQYAWISGWECVDSPLNLHIPYTAEARQGILTSAEMFNPPLENAGGSQLLLAKSVVLPQGPATSEPQLVLWSGCNGSCTDCAEGTGKLWVLEDFPPCTVTASGGVFRLMYNRNPAYQNTHENCWSSLERSDRETEKQSMVQTICSLLSVCSVVGCVIAALLVCVRNSLKRLFSARSLQNTGTGSAAPAYAIGRAAIEKHFPVKYSNEGNLCIVCLLDIEEHEPGRRLQCGHEFHAGCIADWWTHRPRRVLECPLCKCKQRLVEDNPEGDEGQAPTGSVATAPETATADVDRSYGRSNEVEGIQVA